MYRFSLFQFTFTLSVFVYIACSKIEKKVKRQHNKFSPCYEQFSILCYILLPEKGSFQLKHAICEEREIEEKG